MASSAVLSSNQLFDWLRCMNPLEKPQLGLEGNVAGWPAEVGRPLTEY
jgi:hypothetical protein